MKVLSEEMAVKLQKSGELQDFLEKHEVFITKKAKEYLNDNKKPEHLTHLNGTRLVPKTDPRIIFRGKMDSFQAKVLEVQNALAEEKNTILYEELDDILHYCRKILAAEVKEKPLGHMILLGMDEKELRYVSQHPKEKLGVDHMAPEAYMGKVCVMLNRLRTESRELELAGVKAFCVNGDVEREDIIRALNRLSSGIYVLYCRYLAVNLNEERCHEGK